jgi:hypothetical protein
VQSGGTLSDGGKTGGGGTRNDGGTASGGGRALGGAFGGGLETGGASDGGTPGDGGGPLGGAAGSSSGGSASGGMGYGGSPPEDCPPGTIIDTSVVPTACLPCPPRTFSDGYNQVACQPHHICSLSEDVIQSATPKNDVSCAPARFEINFDVAAPGNTRVTDIDVRNNVLYVGGLAEGRFAGDTISTQKGYLYQRHLDLVEHPTLEYFGGADISTSVDAVRVGLDGAIHICGSTDGDLFGQRKSLSDVFFLRRDHTGVEETDYWGAGPDEYVGNCRMLLYPVGHVALSDAVHPRASVAARSRIWERFPGEGAQVQATLFELSVLGMALGSADEVFLVAAESQQPLGDILFSFDDGFAERWSTRLDPSYGRATSILWSEGRVLISTSSGFIVAFDSDSGELELATQLDANVIEVQALAQGPESQIYAVGRIRGDFTGQSAGSDDIFVASLSTKGVREWAQQYGTDGGELVSEIAVGETGEIYIAVRTYRAGVESWIVRSVRAPEH